MATENRATILWRGVADALDIPKSLYVKAAERHKAFGSWLCRPNSSLAPYSPHVSPQGSFRFGTVVLPIYADAEYDLDHVVVLRNLSPSQISQKELKEGFGQEVAAYAEAHGMKQPSEHNRCWRLNYRDEVSFHLDTVPSLLASDSIRIELEAYGVAKPNAERAIAITDRRTPNYGMRDPNWPTSNPRGFARWFESRAASGRAPSSTTSVRAGEVEDVPPYEWKSPLQRSIQILKRHRDVMFRNDPDTAPISMIITNLSASAYRGELDLGEALTGIMTRMPDSVRANAPRVPNPTHPREDYADKWARNRTLESNFWRWHQQASADIQRISDPLRNHSPADLDRTFNLQLSPELEKSLKVSAPSIILGDKAAAPTSVQAGPKPWRNG